MMIRTDAIASQVSRAAYIPCVAQHMPYTRTSQCQSVHWVARVARATYSIDSLKVKGKTRLDTGL